MSSESIERFSLYRGTLAQNTRDGEYVRYSDHQRIVKELEAENQQLKLIVDVGTNADPGTALQQLARRDQALRATTLSDAIKEVEKMRAEWDSIPTEGHDVHADGYHYGQTCKDAASQIVERLKSLGPQKG